MRLGKRLYSLVMFVAVAAIAGLLTSGLVVPAAALLTTGGKSLADSLDNLPTELTVPPQSEKSTLLTADGKLLANFYDQNRIYAKLADIAPIMQKAQVAIEDHRYYEHGAIDLYSTVRALFSTAQGVTQGASSITQQYVRLVLLEQADLNNDDEARTRATENTLSRKVRELRYAMALEKQFTKDEILERYLNISYYGDGAYGVEAAARHYFGVKAKDLSLAQAAMLAGLVRNPNATNPVKYPALAIERRNNVLDRMAADDVAVITKAEAEAAKKEPFDPKAVTDNQVGCVSAEFPFICQYAQEVLVKQAKSLGATDAERKQRLYRGGLTIKISVEPKIQRKNEKVISDFIDAKDPVVSVITMIEPSTGRILSMAQSRQVMGDNKDENGKDEWKGETYYNYAVTHDMQGADGFQGGSTFKAFVAAAALEKGMGAYGKYNAKSSMEFEGPYHSCEGNFMLNDPWPVKNAGGSGFIDMFSGVKNSVNTYFAQLIQAAGVCEAVTMADKLGLKIGLPKADRPDVMSYNDVPSFTLGTIEVSPLSLVSAYSTFANRGVHCEPVILDSIKTKDGTELEVPSANCKRVISKDVADAINKIFQGPYNGGTATAAKVPGVQMAGKTGTVPDNKAVWTMGYTPELAAGAVMSFDNAPRFYDFWQARNGRFLNGAYLKYSEHYVYGRSGSEAGARLLKPAFTYAIDKFEQTRFVEPPSSVLKGEWVSVPSCDGLSEDQCKSKLRKAGFIPFVDKVNSDSAKGTLVGTDPSGKAPKFSSIAIKVSKGPKEGSEAWCKLEGTSNMADPRCVQYLPPPTCQPWEVLIPTPAPGYCQAVQQTPANQGQGNQGGQGNWGGNGNR